MVVATNTDEQCLTATPQLILNIYHKSSAAEIPSPNADLFPRPVRVPLLHRRQDTLTRLLFSAPLAREIGSRLSAFPLIHISTSHQMPVVALAAAAANHPAGQWPVASGQGDMRWRVPKKAGVRNAVRAEISLRHSWDIA